MFVTEIKKNRINVYDVEAKKEELKQYRKFILENYQRKNHDLVYSLQGNDYDVFQTFLANDTSILERELNLDQKDKFGFTKWTKLKVMPTRCDYIVEDYLDGKYDEKIAKRIIPSKPTLALLITQPKKDIICKEYYKIDNLLLLPNELYILQFLLQNKLLRLKNEDIDEQLKLFEKSFCKSFPLYLTKDLISFGVVNDNFEQIVNKAKMGEKILKRIKNK